MRTLAAILFLTRRRCVNTAKRIVRTPALLLPLLLVAPAVLVMLLVSTAVVLAPKWREALPGDSNPLAEHAGLLYSAAALVLLFIVLTIAHRAFEEDLISFRQSDVDFLFPAPLSRRTTVVMRLAAEYAVCILVTYATVPYVLAPVRIFAPAHAGPGWAATAWVGTTLFVIATLNIGRLGQVTLAQLRVESSAWARWIRVAIGAIVAAVLVSMMVDAGQGADPATAAVRALTSRVAYWAMLPCSLAADLFVVVARPEIAVGPRLAVLGAAAVLSTAALVMWSRPTCETSLSATARRRAIWQAVGRMDASSIRAAQLVGRSVRGGPYGLPRLGNGAGALVAKSLLVGLRSSPWGLVLAAAFAVLPAVTLGQVDDPEALRVLRWAPMMLLWLAFAWSPRARFVARDELTHAAMLKSLPIRPVAKALSIVVVPTAGFALFAAALAASVAYGCPAVDRGLLAGAVALCPTLYAALAMVYVCGAALFPQRDTGFAGGYLADLVLLPVCTVITGAVVGAATLAWWSGLGVLVAVLLGAAIATGFAVAGAAAAGALIARVEPGV